MKRRAINGDTGDSEMNSSVMDRSIRCALGLREVGVRTGDVVVLMAPNHLDLAIPVYAALYLGVIVSPVDRNISADDLAKTLAISKPKVIFCQSENLSTIADVLTETKIDCQIVTFDSSDGKTNFKEFIDRRQKKNEVTNFRPNDFDTAKTICVFLMTSGTTGEPKMVAFTHRSYMISIPYKWARFTQFPTPTAREFVIAPLQWLTTFNNFISTPIIRCTRIQITKALDINYAYHIINEYKPTSTTISPSLLNRLLNPSTRGVCDFSNFIAIFVGGSGIPMELIHEAKKVMPDVHFINVFASTETTIMCSNSCDNNNSIGTISPIYQYRIVDTDTFEDIKVPHTPGELWVKGPNLFKEYYNNPEETKKAFAEGDWFRTGDIVYMDEHDQLYYVDRCKLLLKHYTNKVMCNMSPLEIENVIRKKSGVLDVCVTSVPDPAVGDLPVACVVVREGCDVTAQQIKDIVKESLADPKHLRGGVVFLKTLPLTSTTKVDRKKLKMMVAKMERL